jgi:hypothetical protein
MQNPITAGIDFEWGRRDALAGVPRESTRPYYRKGYDRGLTESIAQQRKEVK